MASTAAALTFLSLYFQHATTGADAFLTRMRVARLGPLSAAPAPAASASTVTLLAPVGNGTFGLVRHARDEATGESPRP